MDIPENNESTNSTEKSGTLSFPPYKNTRARMKDFLEAYTKCGRVNRACEIAEIDRGTHYHHLANDAEYQQAFAEAQRRRADLIEDEIVRRAIDCESDTLLMFLARGAMPERYRERISSEVTVNVHLADRIKAADERMLELKRNASPNSSSPS